MTADPPFLPSDIKDARSVIAVQLPGLELTRDSCFVDGIHLTRLSYFDWRLLEKSTIAQELLSDYSHRPRYFCVFAFPFDVDDAQYRLVLWHVDQLFMALWLQQDGTLIDHHYTTRYVRIGSRVGEVMSSTKQNKPGMYGCELLVTKLAPAYVLHQADIPALEASVRLLRSYRTFRSNPAIDVSLGNFRWLHGPSLVTRERLTLLFTALEGLFGGFRERIRGATMGTRVEVVLPADEGGTRTRNFIDKKLRELRNLVAHGGIAPQDAAVDDVLTRLRAIVRASLLKAVRFAIVFPEIEDRIRQVVGSVEPWSVQTTFNHLLALSADGHPEARALLDAQPSFADELGARFGANKVAAARDGS